MIQLPQDFMIRMQDMLGEAYPAFLRSYEEEKVQALRVNALKGTREEFLKKMPVVNLREVPWEENGFYYNESLDFMPGKNPFHEAGVYYIQEPSAMAPATYLDAQPGECVLDLCAAPGGKTTQIASSMNNQGILVCNEIHPTRAKILSENVERMGIRNAIVTNETPQRLVEAFGAYFDRVLVDAPCSGEGMFRKNEAACNEWSLENVQICAKRQNEILDCADRLLRPGGRLVYATCTFAPAENEGSIMRFLERHPEYQVLDRYKYNGMSAGVPLWAYYDTNYQDSRNINKTGNYCAIERTIRLFPHLIQGEGHFLAVLQKPGKKLSESREFPANGLQKGIPIREVKEFLQFQKETLKIDLTAEGRESLLNFGNQLYLMPREMPSINGLKVQRAGLHLGTFKKNRFEPSHALALALKKEQVQRTMELEKDKIAKDYLSGMTLNYCGENGWYLITFQGYSIGWGKLTKEVMKNHYPKGLRKI